MGKKLLAGVLGGVAFFFWSFVAHDVLPLGKAGIKEVPNEPAVLAAMKANGLPEAGLYLLPGLGIPENATRAQQAAAMEARMHKVETGPSGLLAYHPSLQFSFGRALGVELGTNILQVLLAVVLLGQTVSSALPRAGALSPWPAFSPPSAPTFLTGTGMAFPAVTRWPISARSPWDLCSPDW